MDQKPIKCIIKKMVYYKNTHSFVMTLKDAERNREASVTVKATDFGIPPDIPYNIIEEFIKQMEGKEKNLFTIIDKSTIQDNVSDGNKITEEKMNDIYKNLNEYPIDEACNNIIEDIEKDES